ncbi:MAG: hypothetical protein ACR2NS_14745 [Gemmatimonadaceae bacterium]
MFASLIVSTLGFLVLPAGGNPASTSPAIPGQVIDITAGDFFFRSPTTARPGLTTIRLRSPHGGHQFELFRLDDGHGVIDLVNAMTAKKPTPWAKEMGGAGFPPIGGTVNASYILEVGTYAILCEVHDKKDGKRHYQKGMFTELKIAGKRVAGKLPPPEITVTEVDNKWNFSKPITAGPHVVLVTNAGTVAHELKILRILPGLSFAEAKAWKPGQPRTDEQFATVTTMSPGVSVITSINFRPGKYLLWCVPQVKKGMIQELTVPRN